MYRQLLVGWLLIIPMAQALEVAIELPGLAAPLADNVRAFLSLEREKERTNLSTGRVALLHQLATEEIQNALQPFGYFRPAIVASLEATPQGFMARYHIDPGPPLLLTVVDVQVIGPGGNDAELLTPFPLKISEILDQRVYDNAKAALLNRAIERGYLNAQYSNHEIHVDLDSYTAQIRLYLETGTRFRFGPTRFVQDGLDPELLARYQEFHPGDYVTQDKLLNLQARLASSEYFNQVEVGVQREQAIDDHVPLEVILTPSPLDRYRTGLGFATDTGPRLTLDWTRRRLDAQGGRLNTELRVSAPTSRFKSEYSLPLARPWQDLLTISVNGEHQNTDTHQGTRYNLSGANSAGWDQDWQRIWGLDYSYENFTVGEQTGFSHHLLPSLSLSRLRGDRRTAVRNGEHFTFKLQAAVPLLSSSMFLQVHATEKLIYAVDSKRRVLLRGAFGATQAAHLEDLPASQRFFAGGDTSVRGYTLDQLGPHSDTGRVMGGRFLLVTSVELEQRLSGLWSGAIFYDLGNALDPDHANTLARGAGIGLRWQSPIGPVRLDLASALSFNGHPWRLHLVVGPDL